MEKMNVCYLVVNEYNYPLLGSAAKNVLAVAKNRNSAVRYLKSEVDVLKEHLFVANDFEYEECELTWYGDSRFDAYSEKYEFSDILEIVESVYLEDDNNA